MKKLIIFTFSLLLVNCATTKDNLINYDNTNPVKIEEATRGLKVNEILPSPGDIDGTIAIKSIELDVSNNLDIGVAYMIEDNLISNLINNDYRVVERDPDILKSLYLESSNKYKKYNDKFNEENISEEDDVSNTGDTVININNAGNQENEGSDINDDENSKEEFSKTDLNASDYILSYRVLECGVVYNELEKKTGIDINSSTLLQIERSARTRLHVRLTDSKTSEIISANIIENEVTDVVNRSDLADLQQINHEYYHHTLPNQGLFLSSVGLSEDSGYKFNKEKTKIEKFSKPNMAAIKPFLFVGGAILLLMILSGGDEDENYDNDYYYNNYITKKPVVSIEIF